MAAKPKTRSRTSRKAIDQPFIKAVEKGNVAAARKALDAGADVNCPIYPGTALTHAIDKHAHAMIEMLLAHPDIDIDDGGRSFPPLQSAILVASQRKDRRWVDRLLELGADVEQMSSGWSALSQCVRHMPEDTELFDRLATPKTVNPKDSRKFQRPIYDALQYDRATLFFALLECGAKLDEPALVIAAHKSARAIALELVKRGESPNVADADGETPLMKVTGKHAGEIAKALLDGGADIDARDKNGETALFHAAAVSNVDVARVLLERGADVTIRDRYGRTVAFQLATPCSVEMAELLVAHEVDLTVRDKDGASVADVCREMAGVVRDAKKQKSRADSPKLAEWLRSQLANISKEHRAILEWLARRE